jgi:two-component system chemotaxis response regulator CheY
MKKTILVVDDFNSIRNFVCEILQRKGYQTFGANDGNEAYKILVEKAGEINLVLTDYVMPGCSGLELLKRIKATPNIASVPVIFLTTELNPEKMKQAREAGLASWIKKPYRSDVFFAQIEDTINQSANGKQVA